MYFLYILAIVCGEVSLSLPAPVDASIVQVQQWATVGSQRVLEQVLLNGVSLPGTSPEVKAIIQALSPDALLPALLRVNQTSVLRNHTVLRSRECILEGSQLLWSDRVLCDGKVYLTLDHSDTWTAHGPEAQVLKVLLYQDMKTERISLQEACIKIMRALTLSQEQPVLWVPSLMIIVVAFIAFAALITISLLLSKKQGLRHPGGVLGSIIHYPKDMTDTAPDIKASGYRSL